MKGQNIKKIRKALKNPTVEILMAIHKVYGEKTKTMDQKQIYKATKKLVKQGLLKIN